jgi:hypothetical protein
MILLKSATPENVQANRQKDEANVTSMKGVARPAGNQLSSGKLHKETSTLNADNSQNLFSENNPVTSVVCGGASSVG